MSATTEQPSGLAVVCIGFDEETPALCQVAFSFARRTGVQLRFVNVVENAPAGVWVTDMPLYNVSANLIVDAMERLRIQRENNMRELMTALPKDLRATSAVLSGEVVPAIIADAQDHGANFILTACHPDDYSRLIPRGFTVALRLMAEAPLPVLVTSRSKPLDLDKKHLTVLLADDLQPSTDEAARKAFEFAAFLGGCRVRHTHIHGDFREGLRDAWREIKARHRSLNGDSPEALIGAENDARVAALQLRGGLSRERAVARNVGIEVNVRVGKVQETLEDEILEAKPDLLVFGRHRTLKARPFLIGRLGVRAMLHARLPVLVVPPREQMYAPMPFPARREE